jgi:CBS domain-containing protein
MLVRELMSANPAVCRPDATVAAAGGAMRERRCGFLPVIEDITSRRLVGVVTDRDLLLGLVRTNRPATELLVEACMTRGPKTIGPDDDLKDAAAVMEQAAVHRLPVVQDGRVAGVLSLKDIAAAAGRGWRSSGPNVAERQMAEILEAIAAAQAAQR